MKKSVIQILLIKKINKWKQVRIFCVSIGTIAQRFLTHSLLNIEQLFTYDFSQIYCTSPILKEESTTTFLLHVQVMYKRVKFVLWLPLSVHFSPFIKSLEFCLNPFVSQDWFKFIQCKASLTFSCTCTWGLIARG